MNPEFITWFESCEPEIVRVSDLLAVELSDNPSELQKQLVQIEAWNARMTSMLAWANSFLDGSERANLLARSKEVTDLDREKYLADAVKDERRSRDILEGIVGSIKNRLILGMAIMKAQSGERSTTSSRSE